MEANEHNKRMKVAKDEATRKDAHTSEDRARLRARGRCCIICALSQRCYQQVKSTQSRVWLYINHLKALNKQPTSSQLLLCQASVTTVTWIVTGLWQFIISSLIVES